MPEFKHLTTLRTSFCNFWPNTDEELVLDAFGRLVARYSCPSRSYHNLDHIVSVLAELDTWTDAAMDYSAVSLALWYHDVIYDPRSKVNEMRSAVFAMKELAILGATTDFRDRIYPLIMATKHTGRLNSPDEMLVADIDLSILGRPWPQYLEYAKAIRAEYAWVDQTVFRTKRIEFLKSLTRRNIFSTCYFKSKYEVQALRNIEREIAMYQMN